ncbi:MAG: NAD(P)H-hydrate dehydratase [Synechococcus sp.]|nr:NAD(P)H-hydrate dehydratase [Synechococcus sp.]
MSWPRADADHCLVTTAQMTTLEQEWLASGLPVPALMDKVGVAMAAWCLNHPQWLAQGVLVLVGPGHNGGDGLVVARELAQAHVPVRIWCPLPLQQPLTQEHYRHVRWLGVPEVEDTPDPGDPALWIEALFGLGQSRPLPADLAQILEERHQRQPERLISLDLPAGLDGDSGRPLPGGAARARATLTVGLVKRGLVQDAAIAHVGALHRIEAGVPERLFAPLRTRPVLQVSGADLNTMPRPLAPPAAMKYQRGRLLVVAGSDRYRGASLLALQGAQASGAGSIHAAVPEPVASTLWQLLPELLVSEAVPCNDQRGLDWGLWLHEQRLQRLDTVLLGPGLGENSAVWESQAGALQAFPGLLVLDADGLNQLASSCQGWHWLRDRKGPTWMTPHSSEFGRLFPEIHRDQPLEAARQAADCSGATVLLKGARTVVASPRGVVRQLCSGAADAARTGLGDVLAGFAAGWGARAVACGLSGEALSTQLTAAALLHAEAARCCTTASSASAIVTKLAQDIRSANPWNPCE